jgi:ribosomal-protein-alanine N-acetyltransferase
MTSYIAQSNRAAIRRPTVGDADAFVAMAQASSAYHYPWVDPPKTREAYLNYLNSRQSPTDDGFLICETATRPSSSKSSGAIAGVINLNCIVRGHFQSAYLGYYAFADFARRGLMSEGLKLVTTFAFTALGLHRVESNIQPANVASIALVQKCGFRKEGFSPRYLEVFGEWRDHERWALLADDPIVAKFS